MKPRPPLAPRKHLGQNFLVDPKAKQRILSACELKEDEEVIEIGPGLGHLTEMILPHVKKVYAIERDPRFCEQLQKKFPAEKFKVFDADVLKFDFTKLKPNLKVIGNLPYYISTPIIEKFIEYKGLFSICFFTVQKEFAQRLAAKVNTKDYGSLSCFVQYYADIRILFTLPPSSFKPAPKVTSCFMKLTFRPPQFKVADEDKLFTLIRTAFGQRRKRISNSLKSILGKDTAGIFKKCGLTGEERAENLSLKNYVDIARLLLLIFLVLAAPLKAFAAEDSYGYQLALLDERAQNPQKVLMQKKIIPANASVREFEWILETLCNRCRNSQGVIISALVESWRVVQRRGYTVTLLQFSRQISDFSNIAFQSMRNQKLDIDKVARKLLKDKYPIKK